MIGVFRFPGPIFVFRFLGSDADPDVFPDRHLGARAANLRLHQICFVHHAWLDFDAGRNFVALQFHRHIRFASDSVHVANGARRIFPPRTELLLFGSFFLAFAIKVPLFPFHTWLPDAHTEAPTAGSIMLAGVMLKMGTYGMLRFCLPLFPAAARTLAPEIAVLAIIGIIYGALRHHGANGFEAARGVFLGEPSRFRGARNFCDERRPRCRAPCTRC